MRWVPRACDDRDAVSPGRPRVSARGSKPTQPDNNPPVPIVGIRRTSYFRHVPSIAARDAAALLEVVHDGARDVGLDPFPPTVLFGLARLIPSDACVGYQDADVSSGFRVVEVVEVIGSPPSPKTERAFHTLGWQNPMHCGLHATEGGVLRLSDLLTRRRRLNLEYNAVVWRPHGIDDALRVWLPAPPGRARSIYVERSGKDYTDRERALLTLLRPHLARFRINAESRRRVGGSWGLTPREAEVLGWVARGKVNAEIAAALFISPHTVRKHLENLFEKLDVRTRTAAAAHARGWLTTSDELAGSRGAPYRRCTASSLRGRSRQR